ncbi:hypothetical protein NKG05_02630 [Oerskovia sp. M15]
MLFLDEPTTGLDPESRRSAWDLVGSLLDDGTTVVLTTHYLEEAERLADRLAIMHGGRIVQEGTVAEIVGAEPAHVYVDEQSVRPHLADLPLLPGETVERIEGGTLSIATRDLQRTLAVLLAWATDRDVTFARIEARPRRSNRPSWPSPTSRGDALRPTDVTLDLFHPLDGACCMTTLAQPRRPVPAPRPRPPRARRRGAPHRLLGPRRDHAAPA